MDADETQEQFMLSFHRELPRHLSPRLFIGPEQLAPLLGIGPAVAYQALVVFTNHPTALTADSPSFEIVPRQSFAWNSSRSTLETFQTISEIYSWLGSSWSTALGSEKPSHRIEDLVRTAKAMLLAADPMRSHNVPPIVAFVRAADDAPMRLIRSFFAALFPYLELYRSSTVQALNNSYQARATELDALVPQLTSSPRESAITIIQRLESQSSLGYPKFLLLEYTAHVAERWKPIHGADEHLPLLVRLIDSKEVQRLLRDEKVAGLMLNGSPVLVFPFRPPSIGHTAPDLSDGVQGTNEVPADAIGQQTFKLRAEAHSSSRLSPGDIVAIIRTEHPHANLIHTLISHRAAYFQSTLPNLMAAARRFLDVEADGFFRHDLLDDVGIASPWESLEEICEKVIPTLGQALRLSIGINIYSATTGNLERVFQWPHPDEIINPAVHNPDSVSLAHRSRGAVARAFLQRRSRGEDFVHIPDVSKHRTGYFALRLSTASEYCRKIWYRDTPIGTINFESDSVDRFGDGIRRILDDWTRSIERYIERFLAAQDASWLSLSSTSYHHLHELRQESRSWPESYRSVVQKAVDAFDHMPDDQHKTIGDLQGYLDSILRDYINRTPGPGRKRQQEMIRDRCRFSLAANTKNASEFQQFKIDGIAYQLITRIIKNLASNYFQHGLHQEYSWFSISVIMSPTPAIKISQEQASRFSEEWLKSAGFRPVKDPALESRQHHGLFLSGAMARYLGGFLWIGNRRDEPPRTLVEVVLPLKDGA